MRKRSSAVQVAARAVVALDELRQRIAADVHAPASDMLDFAGVKQLVELVAGYPEGVPRRLRLACATFTPLTCWALTA